MPRKASLSNIADTKTAASQSHAIHLRTANDVRTFPDRGNTNIEFGKGKWRCWVTATLRTHMIVSAGDKQTESRARTIWSLIVARSSPCHFA